MLSVFKKTKESKMTIEEVHRQAEEMLSRHVNDYCKIEVRCWVYHSESRIKNGNPPFTFKNYSHCLCMSVPLDYIKFGLIDVSDLGGKDAATEIVRRWYD